MWFFRFSGLLLFSVLMGWPALAEQSVNSPGKGWLAREVLGTGLEEATGIRIEGLAQFSFATGSHSSGQDDGFAATGNAGSLFFREEKGVAMDQLSLLIHRPVTSNVVSRVTPTPGPAPEEMDIGFGFRTMYGSSVYFLTTEGFEDSWQVGGEAGDPYAPGSSAAKYKLAIPEIYLEAYVPFLEGTNIMAGSWFTPLGGDIGIPYDPPNAFYSHPWAFQYYPAKHVGVLTSSKVHQGPAGIFGVELGVVRGWNTMEDINDDVSYIANLRWRSPDMATWIDLETYHGNEAVEDGSILSDNPGPLRVKSTEAAWRHHFNLDVTHQLDDKMSLRGGALFGLQEGGNIDSDPGGAPGHLITEDSEWYGLLAEVRYSLTPKTKLNGRLEWLNDPDAAKFNAQAGDFYGLTANLNYKLNDFIMFRPEVRYDHFEGEEGVTYFADESNDQLTFTFDTVINF